MRKMKKKENNLLNIELKKNIYLIYQSKNNLKKIGNLSKKNF